MKKSLLIGLYAGILSGAGGIAVAYLLGALTGLWFTQLNWLSIAIASIIPNIIGALLFAKWFQKTSRPTLYYAALTIGVTLLLTINDWANPPAAKFGVVVHPVHVVVALLSIWLVPMWMRRQNQTFTREISRNAASAKKEF